MVINGLSPERGDKGNYVAIFGRNFGNNPGKVYFAKVASPKSTDLSDWQEAIVVECGLLTKNWFNDQIVVEVPEGFYREGAAIMVSGTVYKANTIGDGSDSYSSHLRFYYEKNNRPNLCAIIPTTSISSYQTGIQFNGKNFGSRTANDRVKLRISNDPIDDVSLGIASWGKNGLFDQIIVSTPRLDEGRVSGFVYAQGQESNSLLVRIKNIQDSTLPLIDSVVPASGNKGQYITITGKNFGKQLGEVRFYNCLLYTSPSPRDS